MTTHFTYHTGYAGAYDLLLKRGGQFFPRKGSDGTTTVLLGSQVHTFWEPESTNYARVQDAARYYNFPEKSATSGRLARFILKDVCGLDASWSDPGRRFKQLAEDGFHWHFTHVIPGQYDYLLEFDLCAAYATSLMQEETFLLSSDLCHRADNGALECLRALLPTMPKWLRMTIIGVVASHKMTFGTLKTGLNGYPELQWKTVRKIEYGEAFNCVHRAILRVYRVMQKVKELGADHIKRMHTDSFALSWDIPHGRESAIFAYLDSVQFPCVCKSQGSAVLFNLNEGVIGRKWIGVPAAVRQQLKELPVKPKRYQLSLFNGNLWREKAIVPEVEDNTKPSHILYEQPEIMDTSIYRKSDVSYHKAG